MFIFKILNSKQPINKILDEFVLYDKNPNQYCYDNIDLDKVRQEYINIFAGYRKDIGLSKLNELDILNKHCIEHVKQMSNHNYVWHNKIKNQETAQKLGKLSAYGYRAKFSENVAMIDNFRNSNERDLALDMFNYFLEPGSDHKENLYHKYHTHHGVEFAVNNVNGFPVYFICHTFAHWS